MADEDAPGPVEVPRPNAPRRRTERLLAWTAWSAWVLFIMWTIPPDSSAFRENPRLIALKARLGSPAPDERFRMLRDMVRAGHLSAAEALLRAGTDPNGRDVWQRIASPLNAAIDQGDEEAVRLLLDHGAHASPEGGEVGHATEGGMSGWVLRSFMASGVGPDSPYHGARPLGIAAWRDDPGLTEVLLQWGADPDTPDDQGRTARQIAAMNKDKTIQALIEQYRPSAGR